LASRPASSDAGDPVSGRSRHCHGAAALTVVSTSESRIREHRNSRRRFSDACTGGACAGRDCGNTCACPCAGWKGQRRSLNMSSRTDVDVDVAPLTSSRPPCRLRSWGDPGYVGRRQRDLAVRETNVSELMKTNLIARQHVDATPSGFENKAHEGSLHPSAEPHRRAFLRCRSERWWRSSPLRARARSESREH